ncbi:acyltransferase family protein [Burkholderia pseudomallei]|uniref:acyltransferase family protein n=1 Tax=Burkholderia pseudomallei TaxID=28450 RepID=UPI00053825B5|nr:acyltransferase [Burkholderia pseudomallei]KGV79513.1 acyltransferase family protein [Burkholderia pseudomallei MSHR4375]MBM5648255.1 acyltransferase family protein [Burkholderia pseudomallei]MBM5651916.1 acyltransferase family protein [Burkholderia pseudomallei]
MHRNNFDFLRLFAALMVVVGHAYGIMAHEQPTFLGPQISVLGLIIFFSISGYLVTRSWANDPSLVRFLLKRALRVFPGLIAAISVTTFIIGPIASDLPLMSYLTHRDTYAYLMNGALRYTYGLPGLFIDNPISGAANISLWSLPVEFSLYLATPLVAVLAARRHAFALGLLTIALAFSSIYLVYYYRGQHPVFYGTDLISASGMVFFFTSGAFFAASRSKFYLPIGCLLFAAWIFEPRYFEGILRFPVAMLVAFAIPYIVMTIGMRSWPIIRHAGRFGDLSYGIYLYAFPVQQIIARRLAGEIPVGLSIVLSLAIIIPLAFASWHLVEKRALKVKGAEFSRQPAKESPVEPTEAVR